MQASRSPLPANSALYFGKVVHKRLRPFEHVFSYRVFSLYLDLDDLAACGRRLRCLSHNRWNLFSFHDRDHGPRDGQPLRPWIDARLEEAGIDLAGGPVRLLCYPRLLGYVFNPLSIWFCHHADGSLRALLYEVSNTFGESHSYLLPVEAAQRGGGPVLQSAEKRFYVSPFIGMASRYDFRLTVPGDKLAVAIRQEVPEGGQLLARQSGRRRDLSDRNLLRAFFAYPLMTVKIIAAIHWEALRLWRKGARVEPRPQAPQQQVTLVGPATPAAAE
ncbi:DUF1365 domain-containing protein [Pelagibius marinus]|uniref:DUF1365 domain-containing protein n=1 Tax=Pelagibius marinus TaxID=2762760 RepID=UPI0018732BF0|nr:DUF1365 domain-containing protein [Pelagibius marinus]